MQKQEQAAWAVSYTHLDVYKRQRMRGELPPAYAPYANAGTGFGLNNVDRRIRLYYDQEEGLSIESGPERCV